MISEIAQVKTMSTGVKGVAPPNQTGEVKESGFAALLALLFEQSGGLSSGKTLLSDTAFSSHAASSGSGDDIKTDGTVNQNARSLAQAVLAGFVQTQDAAADLPPQGKDAGESLSGGLSAGKPITGVSEPSVAGDTPNVAARAVFLPPYAFAGGKTVPETTATDGTSVNDPMTRKTERFSVDKLAADAGLAAAGAKETLQSSAAEASKVPNAQPAEAEVGFLKIARSADTALPAQKPAAFDETAETLKTQSSEKPGTSAESLQMKPAAVTLPAQKPAAFDETAVALKTQFSEQPVTSAESLQMKPAAETLSAPKPGAAVKTAEAIKTKPSGKSETVPETMQAKTIAMSKKSDIAKNDAGNGGSGDENAAGKTVKNAARVEPTVSARGDGAVPAAVSAAGSAPVSAAAVTEEKRTAAAQTAQAVVRAVNTGKTELSVRLHPDNLGGITVRVAAQNGTVSVKIIADSPDTGRLIAGGMQDIKNAVASQGVTMSKTEVVFSGGSFSGGGGNPGGFGTSWGSNGSGGSGHYAFSPSASAGCAEGGRENAQAAQGSRLLSVSV